MVYRCHFNICLSLGTDGDITAVRRGDYHRWICQTLLALLMCLVCVKACQAFIIPPGATGGCCCGACVSAAASNTSTHSDRVQNALACLDDIDRKVHALPRTARFFPLMASERATIEQQAENTRQLFSTVQPVSTVEAAVSAVEASVRHYALWPLRAQLLNAAAASHRPEPTWGVLVGSEFMRTTEYLLPVYDDRAVELSGMRGEQVSTQIIVFPFDQALTLPYHAVNAGSGLRVDPLLDDAGHAISPTQWTLMTVLPWWRCLDGHPTPAWNTTDNTEYSDALHPLADGEQLAVPVGTMGLLRCRLTLPLDQPPGTYHGTMHFSPLNQGAQEVPITVTVWPATMPTIWPLSVEAGSDAGLPGNVSPEALSAIGRTYHITIVPNQTAPQRPRWNRVSEPGSLSRNAGLLAIRLLAWDAWARHAPGISIPVLYRWQWLGLPVTVVDGQTFLSRPPSFLGAVGDLVYPCAERPDTLQPSIRLEVLRDGLADAACLQRLADALEHNTVPAADRHTVEQVLEQARKLAKAPTAPEATSRFTKLRQQVAELLSHLP